MLEKQIYLLIFFLVRMVELNRITIHKTTKKKCTKNKQNSMCQQCRYNKEAPIFNTKQAPYFSSSTLGGFLPSALCVCVSRTGDGHPGCKQAADSPRGCLVVVCGLLSELRGALYSTYTEGRVGVLKGGRGVGGGVSLDCLWLSSAFRQQFYFVKLLCTT